MDSAVKAEQEIAVYLTDVAQFPVIRMYSMEIQCCNIAS